MGGMVDIESKGTSPRMRGKHQLSCLMAADLRNIPAYAGKTDRGNNFINLRQEHPRVCGENLAPYPLPFLAYRNIPAYAGKTAERRCSYAPGLEHPRVCGENQNIGFESSAGRGTSPRMRGKRIGVFLDCLHKRNIPAYAGKTPPPKGRGLGFTEHPRVCGENTAACVGVFLDCGTSPRMRGKL